MKTSLELKWKRIGPSRETSIEIPPVGRLIENYGFAYDEATQRIVYAVESSYQALEAFAFDGDSFSHFASQKFSWETGKRPSSFWDAARKGVACWTVSNLSALGILITADGVEPIATRGELPKFEKGDYFDALACFAFDRAREVTLCFARSGIWELAASGEWRKVKGEVQALPASWKNDGFGGAWDPKNKQVAIWHWDKADAVPRFYAWDGTDLKVLPNKGLPKFSRFEFYAVCPHSKDGLVLVSGSNLYALGDEAWTKFSNAKSDIAPPQMHKVQLVYDPKRDAFLMGPGERVNDDQRVFWEFHDGAWRKLGVEFRKSPTESLYNGRLTTVVDGRWIAVAKWSMHSMFFDDKNGWTDILGGSEGREFFSGGMSVRQHNKGEIIGLTSLITTGDEGVAIGTQGEMFLLSNENKWRKKSGAAPIFKTRPEACAAWDAGTERLVVWGGKVKNRASNDTFVYEKSAWRLLKPSPAPKKDKTVEFVVAYDAALGGILRFTETEVALFQGEEWRVVTPKGYAKLVGDRSWDRIALHDGAETLLFNLRSGLIYRFDLSGCEPLAHVGLPEDLRVVEGMDMVHHLGDLYAFDPKTKQLFLQDNNDERGSWALDLSDVFALAHKGAPRKLLDAPPARSSTKRAAKSKASKIDTKDLMARAGTTSQALALKKARKGVTPLSRVGGGCGIAPSRWPKDGKTPLAFLLQIATGNLLNKHAGVAVFCPIDGTATEDGDSTVALLLSNNELEGASSGTSTFNIHELTMAKPLWEPIRTETEKLAAEDPEVGAAIEALAEKGQDAECSSKLGGEPLWVQDAAAPRNCRFIGQLDFDGVSLGGAGDDAGLFGVLYIFVKEDESAAKAFWQTT